MFKVNHRHVLSRRNGLRSQNHALVYRIGSRLSYLFQVLVYVLNISPICWFGARRAHHIAELHPLYHNHLLPSCFESLGIRSNVFGYRYPPLSALHSITLATSHSPVFSDVASRYVYIKFKLLNLLYNGRDVMVTTCIC